MRGDGAHARPMVGHVPDPPSTVGPRFPEPPTAADEETERFLRPYAVDAGTADRPTDDPVEHEDDLDMLTLLVAARLPGEREVLRPERETILLRAVRARTLAELAAELRLPFSQVRSIVAHMIADGSLQRCGPSRPLERQDILHAVLVGLRSL
ncbi:DUF742 domain-containing protein [Nocardiopsis sp. NRRL B-16309]|uniref:DUF742 domain-containing protein n=1 Tax=Nocardiopsis sp. NRRL B-16309 TaxID=1519494 RepID=UPI0006AF6422|nr:DUF742 domain-containing protein [Nocardiopsis sp. NRRL B-16309]KOX12033.1 hypothetical protein ADL05_22315 [Nocardiopsis sp. NRRL B-16309]